MGVNAVLYYGPTIFENAGLSSGDSLFSQILVGMVNMLTTVLALVIIDRVGRKSLVYWGVSGMILSLVCIGLYFLWGAAWGVSSTFLLIFFLAYIFCCAVSICAVIWVLLSEMYPTRIRGLAMSIAGLAPVDRHLPDRPVDAVDARKPHPRRYVLPLRRHVRSLYPDYLEGRSRNHGALARRDRKVLAEIVYQCFHRGFNNLEINRIVI